MTEAIEGYPRQTIVVKENGHRYEATFEPTKRELEPVDFDYHKRLSEEIDDLEKNGRGRADFDLVAAAEFPPAEITEEKVTIKFVMPGPLRIVIAMNFDRTKMEPQDWKGKLGLRFRCKLRRMK